MRQKHRSISLLTFLFPVLITFAIARNALAWSNIVDYPDYVREETFKKNYYNDDPSMIVNYAFKRSVTCVDANGRYGYGMGVEWVVGYTDGTCEVFPRSTSIHKDAPSGKRIAYLRAQHYQNDITALILGGIDSYVLAETEVDTDLDGVNDIDEVNVYGLNPLNPDVDGDGLPDGWEIDNGFDPDGVTGSLLAHWTFDDFLFFENSTQIRDVSENNIFGWLTNPETNGIVEGRVGNALAFSTNNAQLGFINDRDALDLADTAFTISCWYKSTESNNRIKYLAMKGGYWNANYGLAAYGDHIQFVAKIWGGEVKRTPKVPECVVLPGQWHHIAGVFDHYNLRLYIDGFEVSSIECAPNRYVRLVPNNDGLLIGHNVDGFLDDVRIYHKALTAAEVGSIYEVYSDEDHDGLTVFEEYEADTDPNSEDTDNDGLGDGWEVTYGFNPNGVPYEPIGSWGFDDIPSWHQVFDDSVNNYYGWVINPESNYTCSGVRNDAFEIPADSTQFIYISHNYTNLNVADNSVTIACWYKRTVDADGFRVIAMKDVNNPNYGLCEQNGYIQFKAKINGTIKTTGIYPSTFVGTNQWAYLAGVYEEPYLKLYIDGELVSYTYGWGNLSTVPGSGFIIGNECGGGQWNMIGQIDELRVYDEALTESEIQDLMEAGDDADGDGVSNFGEYKAGTDPWIP